MKNSWIGHQQKRQPKLLDWATAETYSAKLQNWAPAETHLAKLLEWAQEESINLSYWNIYSSMVESEVQ